MTDIRTIIAELRELDAKWKASDHNQIVSYEYQFLCNVSVKAMPRLLDYIAKLEIAAKSLDEVTEVLAANDKGPGSGWFAPCLNRARAALRAVGY